MRDTAAVLMIPQRRCAGAATPTCAVLRHQHRPCVLPARGHARCSGARGAHNGLRSACAGPCRVANIGEIIESLPFVERVVTLLIPAVHRSIAEAYAKWDRLGGPVGDNDLEPTVPAVAPELGRWRDRFGDVFGWCPRLADSDSTWWVDGENPGPGHLTPHTVRAVPSPF